MGIGPRTTACATLSVLFAMAPRPAAAGRAQADSLRRSEPLGGVGGRQPPDVDDDAHTAEELFVGERALLETWLSLAISRWGDADRIGPRIDAGIRAGPRFDRVDSAAAADGTFARRDLALLPGLGFVIGGAFADEAAFRPSLTLELSWQRMRPDPSAPARLRTAVDVSIAALLGAPSGGGAEVAIALRAPKWGGVALHGGWLWGPRGGPVASLALQLGTWPSIVVGVASLVGLALVAGALDGLGDGLGDVMGGG
jgi:hypothetical protein